MIRTMYFNFNGYNKVGDHVRALLNGNKDDESRGLSSVNEFSDAWGLRVNSDFARGRYHGRQKQEHQEWVKFVAVKIFL